MAAATAAVPFKVTVSSSSSSCGLLLLLFFFFFFFLVFDASSLSLVVVMMHHHFIIQRCSSIIGHNKCLVIAARCCRHGSSAINKLHSFLYEAPSHQQHHDDCNSGLLHIQTSLRMRITKKSAAASGGAPLAHGNKLVVAVVIVFKALPGSYIWRLN